MEEKFCFPRLSESLYALEFSYSNPRRTGEQASIATHCPALGAWLQATLPLRREVGNLTPHCFDRCLIAAAAAAAAAPRWPKFENLSSTLARVIIWAGRSHPRAVITRSATTCSSVVCKRRLGLFDCTLSFPTQARDPVHARSSRLDPNLPRACCPLAAARGRLSATHACLLRESRTYAPARRVRLLDVCTCSTQAPARGSTRSARRTLQAAPRSVALCSLAHTFHSLCIKGHQLVQIRSPDQRNGVPTHWEQ